VKKSSRGRGAHLAERGEENREDDTGDGGGSSSTLGKRRRTWGRDRRARPPPAAARISSRRASSVDLASASIPRRSAGVGRRAAAGSPLLLLSPPLPRARLELPHGARIHLPRCFTVLPFPPGRWLTERPRSGASTAPFSASAASAGVRVR